MIGYSLNSHELTFYLAVWENGSDPTSIMYYTNRDVVAQLHA